MVSPPPPHDRTSPRFVEEHGDRLAAVRAEIAARRLPPVESFSPAHCGEIDIRIARDGRWYYRGSVIDRPELVRLFASVLRREGTDHFLVTPVEKLRITVDDCPYLAVELERVGAGEAQTLVLRLQTDERLIVDRDHAIEVGADERTAAPAPSVHVRDGLVARIARPVFYELVDLAVPAVGDAGLLGVWSAGTFFPLGRMEEGD
ncbi:MAG: DUF1285 domain-containing protein [Alphaproteobacteria bacterium]|nr:MAG: DUF1285 domain-containing protein [Alphaproteobacteria bacterium]